MMLMSMSYSLCVGAILHNKEEASTHEMSVGACCMLLLESNLLRVIRRRRAATALIQTYPRLAKRK